MVKVISTGETRKIIIKNETSGISDSEAEERMALLADLKIPPREEEPNMLLLARGERMYEEATGDRRNRIEFQMRRFDAALERQDKHEVESLRREINEYLNRLVDEK